MEGGGVMWVAEVGTGLKGAIGDPIVHQAKTQSWRDPMNILFDI